MRHLCRPSEKVGSLETQNDGMMNADIPAARIDRQYGMAIRRRYSHRS
jgi:hypothetical protein